MANTTRPVGVHLNGSTASNTTSPAPRIITRERHVVATTVSIHGLEDDHELYERVLQRVRTAGETVPFEAVCERLDSVNR